MEISSVSILRSDVCTNVENNATHVFMLAETVDESTSIQHVIGLPLQSTFSVPALKEVDEEIVHQNRDGESKTPLKEKLGRFRVGGACAVSHQVCRRTSNPTLQKRILIYTSGGSTLTRVSKNYE